MRWLVFLFLMLLAGSGFAVEVQVTPEAYYITQEYVDIEIRVLDVPENREWLQVLIADCVNTQCTRNYDKVTIESVVGLEKCRFSDDDLITCRIDAEEDGGVFEALKLALRARNVRESSSEPATRLEETETWRVFLKKKLSAFSAIIGEASVNVRNPEADVSLLSAGEKISGSVSVQAKPLVLNGAASNPAEVSFALRPAGTSQWSLSPFTKEGLNWRTEWNTSTVPDGNYELAAIACDAYAHCDTNPKILTRIVDNVEDDVTPPAIQVNVSEYGPFRLDPGQVIDVDFSDDRALARADYRVGQGDWLPIIQASEPFPLAFIEEWALSWSEVPEGVNEVDVRSLDDSGNEALLENAFTFSKDTTGPTAPSELVVEVVGTALQLSWQPSSDDFSVSHYLVMRKSFTQYVEIAQTQERTHTDADVEPGRQYYYVIRARDTAGNWSGNSNVALGSLPAVEEPVPEEPLPEPPVEEAPLQDITAPSPPEGLSAVAGVDEIRLTWQASVDDTGVTGYLIYRSVGPGSPLLYGQTASTNFEDRSARTGTRYDYWVSAMDAAKNESRKAGPVEAVIEHPVQAPVIRSIIVTPESGPEGEPFVFSAEVEYDGPGPLTFVWDFGNGDTATVSGTQQVASTYFLDLGELEHTFKVSLTVRDQEGLEGTASAEVSVAKSLVKVKLVAPHPVASLQEPLHKDEENRFRFRVLDLDDKPLPFEDLFSVSAFLGEEEIVLEQVQEREEFSGTVAPGEEIPSPLAYVQVTAITKSREHRLYKLPQTTTASLPLRFEPLSLKAGIESLQVQAREEALAEKLYWGNVLEGVLLSVTYPDGGGVDELSFEAILETSLGELKGTLTPKDGAYLVTIAHPVTLEDVKQGLRLHLTGQDTYGNRLEETLELPAVRENPFFSLRVNRPNLAVYDTFGYGQPVTVEAIIASQKIGEVSPPSVWIEDLTFGRRLEMIQLEEGRWQRTLRLPQRSTEIQKVEYVVRAEAHMGEQFFADAFPMMLNLSPKLEIDFKYPLIGTTTLEGDTLQELRVQLKYPNGDILEKEEVQAGLTVGEESYDILLSLDSATQTHVAEMPVPLGEGTHALRLQVPGFEADSTLSAQLTKQIFSLENATTAAIFIVALVLGIFLMSQAITFYKEQTEKTETLLHKAKHVEGLMRKLRYEYYKRHISAKEYKERLLRLQQEFESVTKRLKKRKGVKIHFEEMKIPRKEDNAVAKGAATQPSKKADKQPGVSAPAKSVPVKSSEPRPVASQHAVPLVPPPAPAKPAEPYKEPLPIPAATRIPALPPVQSIPKPSITVPPQTMPGPKPAAPAPPSAASLEAKLSGLSNKEREAVKRLVPILRPHAKQYTDKEIVTAVLSEGFSEVVAEKVLEQLRYA